MKYIITFLIGAWFGYVIHPDETTSHRVAALRCDADPLRYNGFVSYDGSSYHCFRRSSQYPYRINHFVMILGDIE